MPLWGLPSCSTFLKWRQRGQGKPPMVAAAAPARLSSFIKERTAAPGEAWESSNGVCNCHRWRFSPPSLSFSAFYFLSKKQPILHSWGSGKRRFPAIPRMKRPEGWHNPLIPFRNTTGSSHYHFPSLSY